jgi:iron-sulfur cluster insertion protein
MGPGPIYPFCYLWFSCILTSGAGFPVSLCPPAESRYNRLKETPLHHMSTTNVAETVINVSSMAASKITELLTEENKPESGLRVFVQGGGCSGFQYGLMIEDAPGDTDQVLQSNGVKLYVDPISIRYLKGAEVDFVDNVAGGGFTIRNPNAVSTCGCGQSFTMDEDSH